MNVGDAFEGSEIKALVQRLLMPLVALALEAEIPFPSGAAAVRRGPFLFTTLSQHRASRCHAVDIQFHALTSVGTSVIEVQGGFRFQE